MSSSPSFLGTGFRYPVRVDATGALRWSSGEDAIRESIWIVLSTPKRSRMMRPDFGCGIHDYVFKPNNAATHALIIAEVRTALTRWEPRIDVLDVRAVAQRDTPSTLLIELDYRTRANNASHNVVYPFYLNEGQAPGA